MQRVADVGVYARNPLGCGRFQSLFVRREGAPVVELYPRSFTRAELRTALGNEVSQK